MSDLYCVLGNPIEHSKSPLIHNEFALQTQQKIEYTAQLAPLDGFTDAWRTFVDKGGRGPTLPYPLRRRRLRSAIP